MTNTNTKLSFITPTVLDEAFLFVMGASVKKTENPIGFFGTGLKYAIAVTMRLGGDIVITTGIAGGSRTVYSFRKVVEQLRGEDMPFIMCEIARIYNDNGDETVSLTSVRMPMTADYGKTWEPWMALRELWSNTRDENGYVIEGDRTVRLEIDHETQQLIKHELPSEYTRIVVDCPTVYEAWLQRDKYFINEARKPIYGDAAIDIYAGNSDVLFYRGIRVTKGSGFKSALTYNIKTLHDGVLSEDRTVDPYYAKSKALWAIGHCEDSGLIKMVLEGSTDENNMEHSLPYGAWTIHDDMNELYAREAVHFVKRNLDRAPTGLKTQVFDYLDRTDADRIYGLCDLTDAQRARFDECIVFLKLKGINFDDISCRILFSRELNGFAACKPLAKTIWLNPDKTLVDENYKRPTCMSLIEEYVHCRWMVEDGTREMQERYNEIVYELCRRGEVQ